MIQMAGGIDDVDTNFCLIKSDADQYDYFFIGVLYEWCLCTPETVFLLAERLDRLIDYAIRSFQ